MEAVNKELIRVSYTYIDGTEKYIEGANLLKWIEFNAIVARHAARDGVNPNWEDIKWTDPEEEIFY
jgi:hypothetical protein